MTGHFHLIIIMTKYFYYKQNENGETLFILIFK
jgi:hypothetical protein